MPPLAAPPRPRNSQQISPEEALEIIDYYEPRPTTFITDVLKATPWGKQKEIIDAVFKYPIVACKSCNASGKSYIAARVALAFLTLKPGSIVITTAPTWRQVKDVLWREIKTAYNMSAYKLSKAECNQVGLDFADDWYAVGLSTKDSEKFFGYHADDILVIVDEASGVEEEIFVGVDAVTPNLNAHVLMIGNPTNPEGRFYKAFHDPKMSAMVKKITISAFDTPNFTANGVRDVEDLVALFDPPPGVDQLEHMIKVQKGLKTPYASLINPMKVYQRLGQWGTDHPMWDALILGEFPKQATNSLIPLNLIMKATDVWRQIVELQRLEQRAKTDPVAAEELKNYTRHPEWAIPYGTKHEYGMDVARFGDDLTVLYPRLGGFVEKATVWPKTPTDVSADRAIAAMAVDDWHSTIKVDDTGVGGGVTDNLNRALRLDPGKYHFKVVPIDFSKGTQKPEQFFNLRSEMYWNLREQFVEHKIAIPPDEDLMADLAAIRYDYAGKDRTIIKVELKEQMKERLKRSPDRGDALMLAFAKAQYGSFHTEAPRVQPAVKHTVHPQGAPAGIVLPGASTPAGSPSSVNSDTHLGNVLNTNF